MVTDSYTGDVSPGGPPAVRQLDGLTLTKVAVDPDMSNNCYLLECTDTGEVVLIDAAAEPERLLELIGDRTLTAIITTHQHWDHHRALADVRSEHPAAVVVGGAADADAITEQTGVEVDRRVGDGDTVAVGTCELEVIPVAGHTPGSICLHRDGHLFTGDSLFPGGPGRTTRREDFESIMRDLQTRVFGALPDSTWFYPGHGNDSTLGAERPHLEEWVTRGW